jgi:membrane-anchored protein YejM (alkaline phosphatase superfamily)
MKWTRPSFTNIYNFPIVVIALLLGLFHAFAVNSVYTVLLLITNYLWTLSLAILIIAIAGKVHRLLLISLSCFVIFLLSLEIIINRVTGLHLNYFVFQSLREQLNDKWEVTVPITLFLAILYFIYKTIEQHHAHIWTAHIKVKTRTLLSIALTSFAMMQMTYSLGYFYGNLESISTKRHLGILIVPHPYYIKKTISFLSGKPFDNPFSASQISNKSANVSNNLKISSPHIKPKHLNVIMVIVDSLRGGDIQTHPELAPNLVKWSQQSSFHSYTHYSTSNCTHFSIYSLLSGEFPNKFSAARQNPVLSPSMQVLKNYGYVFSTSEADTLDWYDTANTVFAGQAKRHIVEEYIDTKDLTAIQNTLTQIKSYRENEQPYLHVTYLNGTHFPYNETATDITTSVLDQYFTAIKKVDKNLGFLLEELQSLNIMDNTLVILTSDHGEEVFENGIIGHSSRLSPDQIQVPIMIFNQVQGMSKQPAPKSHIDIMPYILESMNIKRSNKPDNEPIVLANCDYDYPNGFAVIREGSRSDFILDDGFLYGTQTPYSNTSIEQIKTDTKILLKKLHE